MHDEPELPPHYLQPLLPTPFHQRARALSQLDSFIPWSGYTTVDVFTTVEQEYFAIRNAATLYDLTPMVKYRVAGPDAQRYLDRLVTRDIARLKLNRVCYCVWCDDHGHVIDDGTIFRLGESEYRLCTAERQIDWLLDSARGFDVAVTEVTEQIAALALQGPTSCAVLKQLGLAGVEQLKPFEVGAFETDGLRVTVSRTGFTGDLGYELWVAPEDAIRLWDMLMTRGKSRGIRPIGSRALNLARIEAGFPRRRTSTSSPPSGHSASAARVRRSNSGSAGWSISRRVTSRAGEPCSTSRGADHDANWSASTSMATSRPSMRCSTRTVPGARRSAVCRPRCGPRPASATSRSPWSTPRTSRSAASSGPRST